MQKIEKSQVFNSNIANNSLPRIINKSDKFTLTLGEKFMDKIDFICTEIPDNEWSGVVFYKVVKGSIENIEELEIEAVDLYPLDIGTATYTEFDYTPEYAGYIARNSELLGMHTGLIHSHQKMGVFFSGTDTRTLAEQAVHYKTFLSIIVNNKLDVVAALAVETELSTTKKESIEYQDLDYQKKYHNEKDFVTTTEKVALKFEATINKYTRSVNSEFSNIINTLKEITKAKNAKKPSNNVSDKTYNNQFSWIKDQNDYLFEEERNANSSMYWEVDYDDSYPLYDIREDAINYIYETLYFAHERITVSLLPDDFPNEDNISDLIKKVIPIIAKHYNDEEFKLHLLSNACELYDQLIFGLSKKDITDLNTFIIKYVREISRNLVEEAIIDSDFTKYESYVIIFNDVMEQVSHKRI